MNIIFDCPSCRQNLEAHPDMGGESIICPTCKDKIRIPKQVTSQKEIQTNVKQVDPP